MGRAIEVDKRLDELENKINEVLLMLDELSKVNTTRENIDLHEETKEKTNTKGAGDSNVKSDNGGAKKSGGNNKNSKSSK